MVNDIWLEVDHIVPISAGGPPTPENLVTACSECNGGKSNTPTRIRALPRIGLLARILRIVRKTK